MRHDLLPLIDSQQVTALICLYEVRRTVARISNSLNLTSAHLRIFTVAFSFIPRAIRAFGSHLGITGGMSQEGGTKSPSLSVKTYLPVRLHSNDAKLTNSSASIAASAL